jgi:hypothetical protein
MTDRRMSPAESSKENPKSNQCIYNRVVKSTLDLLPLTVVNEGTHPSELVIPED